jgi:hypothetical protein
MITLLFLSLLLQTSPAPAPSSLTIDLDGDGVPETVSATLHGKKIRIEVTDAAGQRRARAEANAPESGAVQVGLTAGSLGSAGALLEVSASTSVRQCRTVWRLRGRELSSVPIVGKNGKLPECTNPDGWTEQWRRPREDAPADWVRERTRSVAQGEHLRTEVYQFSGFELTLDASRSTAQIDGVWIPEWSSETLYPRPLLESLNSGFDLSAFKTNPRVRVLADRDEGILAIEVQRPAGVERLPIRRGDWDEKRSEWQLTVVRDKRPGYVRLRVTPDQRHPVELSIEGLDDDLRRSYVPISRRNPTGFEVFMRAEDQIALQSLTGAWDSRRGERISINAISVDPTVIEFGKQRVTLDIERAPDGSDLLLLPSDGSAPRTALQLRGPDVFARLPVTCETRAAAKAGTCRVTGPGESFRRIGSQVNSR